MEGGNLPAQRGDVTYMMHQGILHVPAKLSAGIGGQRHASDSNGFSANETEALFN